MRFIAWRGGRGNPLSRNGGFRAQHRGGQRAGSAQHEARDQAVYVGGSHHPFGPLSSPLRDRFGQHYHLDFYGHSELAEIIQRSAHLLEVRIDKTGAAELAARTRGTPRIANRLLRRVRDFAEVNAVPMVTSEVALAALELLEIDACGFDKMDAPS